MPYDTLPKRLRDLIPSEDGQEMFRNVVNSQLAAGKTEAVAMASAWAALERAGYNKGEDGKWVKKTMPTASQVHVPSAEWDDKKRKKKPKVEKASGAQPIYMYRPVMNAEQLHEWAASQGFKTALLPDDMHVTVVFSKAAFSAHYSRLAEMNEIVHYSNVVVQGGKRAVVPLGDKGAVVLKIQSDSLQYEHLSFRTEGASWDFQEYTPHITITYNGSDLDPSQMQPFTGDIVLGPLRAKPLNPAWDTEIREATLPTTVEKQTYQPPEAAKNAAKRVIEWKRKHGSEVKGMTSVGWARARQLASGKPVSRDTVARMSAFNRHRQNAKVDPKFKNAPWKDRGYVAWLGWGGTTGINWARETMGSIAKRMMTDDSFTTREEAAARSYDLGLEGDIHVHQTSEGQAVYMPGGSHEAYLEAMARAGGLLDSDLDDEDEYEAEEDESGTGLLERAISAILETVTEMEKADMSEDVTKTADILKVDTERRIAWGWASVSTLKGELVTDLQGDTITPQEMEKMADRFMASARTAKAMHEGDQIGEVLHSFPITNEIAKAFGMETDREGWIIGMKIHDDAVWQGFKDGTYKAFSIGGRSKRERIA
jgi:cation transport regulator ChaB